ncbi:MAG: arginase [Roseiflexus sp.]|jgi:arginase|nr:arginase [Roseiflexus sp.]MBO9335366.1 arginase [Roseiflexus sp.]MBO9365051.1 arginase [Roseiflexus sp.]MBO9382216.1 arginase [Roseiflexus sp.]MBO9389751.1 arginase [Roseiflexus sp.]
MRDIAIIGVPLDLGAGRRGVDMGPSAIRYAGLRERIAALGYRVRDLGNLAVPLAEQIEPPTLDEPLRYLQPIVGVVRDLAQQVRNVISGNTLPIVLGGDHSLSIGSVAGAAHNRRIGVIWLDAHGDYNTPETTPSGNIHGMGLAVLTGRGHPMLTGLIGRTPVIRPEDAALVGVRNLDSGERELLRTSGVHVFTMHDIDRRGMAAVMEEAILHVSSSTSGFHLSFDLDVLDPHEAPGVGTPVLGGITYREAHLAMELVAASGRLISLDLVEVNPILDTRNMTALLAVEFALSALGKTIY